MNQNDINNILYFNRSGPDRTSANIIPSTTDIDHPDPDLQPQFKQKQLQRRENQSSTRYSKNKTKQKEYAKLGHDQIKLTYRRRYLTKGVRWDGSPSSEKDEDLKQNPSPDAPAKEEQKA